MLVFALILHYQIRYNSEVENYYRNNMETFKTILVKTAQSAMWVLLFLALIQPFGIDQMKEGRILFILSQTGISFIGIFLSCCISNLLVIRSNNNELSLKAFVVENVLMSVINIPLLGAMLITFDSWFNTGNIASYWVIDGHLTFYPMWVMCISVSCISVFLLIFACFQYRADKLKYELDYVKSINAMLEKRQEKMEIEEDNLSGSVDNIVESQAKITIIGQGQDSSLEVCPNNIIYVESMANYADICYIADNETKHTTLRITLKQIRETLEATDCIVQCHRAFLVNLNFVVAMTNRNPGYQLQLFGMDKQIPVSRANTEIIKNRLSGF